MRTHNRRLVRLLRRVIKPKPRLFAEAGVWKGENAANLLRSFPDMEIILVDPYQPIPEGCPFWNLKEEHMTKADYNTVRLEAMEAVAFAGKRVTWMFEPDTTAAPKLKDGSLDGVFIDGLHDYESVAASLRAWYPKVRRGGFFSGHDFFSRAEREARRGWGAGLAVIDFFAVKRLPLNQALGKIWWTKIP